MAVQDDKRSLIEIVHSYQWKECVRLPVSYHSAIVVIGGYADAR